MEKAKASTPAQGKGIIAVAMIKSPIGAKPDAKKTLFLLGMWQINTARLLFDSPRNRSMLQKVKDYVTWGTVTPEFAEEVFLKRGKAFGGKKLTPELAKKAVGVVVSEGKLSEIGVKKDVHLHPPKGGFKGTLKRPLTQRGEAGDRKEKIADLVGRMI